MCIVRWEVRIAVCLLGVRSGGVLFWIIALHCICARTVGTTRLTFLVRGSLVSREPVTRRNRRYPSLAWPPLRDRKGKESQTMPSHSQGRTGAQPPTVRRANAPWTRGQSRSKPAEGWAVPSFRKQPYPLTVPQQANPSSAHPLPLLSGFHSTRRHAIKIQPEPRASSKTIALLVQAPHSRTPRT
jgi:hypothetical protein